MNLLTIVVPSYNSAAYLGRALDSLLGSMEALDVIVVNDGSSDATAEVAATYVERYPEHIRLFNKENGGHGSGVNLGMREARAPWFKILDSDDRLDPDGLAALLDVLRGFSEQEPRPELVVSDFCYEIHRIKNGEEKIYEREADYSNVFKPDSMNSWSRMRSFKIDQLLMMHALCYRTDLLYKIRLRLPEKTYYEDNVFVLEPLPHVRRIYYLHKSVYRYFIGRQDQSVNFASLLKNVHMQITVTLELFRRISLESVRPQRLQRYMYRHMSRMVAMCIIPLAVEGTPEARARIMTLWEELVNINPAAAKKLKASPILNLQKILTSTGATFNERVYNLMSKVFVL